MGGYKRQRGREKKGFVNSFPFAQSEHITLTPLTLNTCFVSLALKSESLLLPRSLLSAPKISSLSHSHTGSIILYFSFLRSFLFLFISSFPHFLRMMAPSITTTAASLLASFLALSLALLAFTHQAISVRFYFRPVAFPPIFSATPFCLSFGLSAVSFVRLSPSQYSYRYISLKFYHFVSLSAPPAQLPSLAATRPSVGPVGLSACSPVPLSSALLRAPPLLCQPLCVRTAALLASTLSQPLAVLVRM